jgi:hypothetical protein
MFIILHKSLWIIKTHQEKEIQKPRTSRFWKSPWSLHMQFCTSFPLLIIFIQTLFFNSPLSITAKLYLSYAWWCNCTWIITKEVRYQCTNGRKKTLFSIGITLIYFQVTLTSCKVQSLCDLLFPCHFSKE